MAAFIKESRVQIDRRFLVAPECDRVGQGKANSHIGVPGHKPIGREKRRRFEPSGKMCVEG